METIKPLLQKVRAASWGVQRLNDAQKKDLLMRLAVLVEDAQEQIIQENQKDLVRMADDDPKKDRLLLTPERIQGLADSLRDVANLEDPTGRVLSDKVLDNGLSVTKISVPIGVVGIIYESRPNVTIDVAALCLRSGNACVLRGGSDAFYSNSCLVGLIHQALASMEVNTDCICLLPTDRKFVKELLEAVDEVDILIPRGSQQLIDFVRENASVPTIETGAGVCHTFVSQHADLEKAAQIVVNAKVSRPSVCNALDTLLVAKEVANDLLPSLIDGFTPQQVGVYADASSFDILKEANYPHLHQAEEADFGREFLSYNCSIKVVNDLEEALLHIRKYSSKHSEAIVSENKEECERFLQEIDAAAVYANASTRFTDGGVFGLGAEIGISTQKLHARGPFALEKLTTEKWVVRGDGQTR